MEQAGKSIAGVSLFSTFLPSCKKDLQHAEHNTQNSAGKIKRTVIVIGAGAAGMVAASLLKKKGFKVIVLEAAAMYGGRIKTLQGFADFSIEAGAEYIHGKNTLWYQWNEAFDPTFVNYPPEDFYALDGSLQTWEQANMDPDFKKCEQFYSKVFKYTGPDKTVFQYSMEQGVAERVRHISNADIGNDWGTSNEVLSTAGIAEEDNAWTAGNKDYLVKNHNYLQVLEQKCANILPDILFGRKVTGINFTGSKVNVTDSTGADYAADRVIITVPLSILQNGSIQFTPALPTWKKDAISNIRMGNGMKIFLKFSSRFWDKNLRYIYGYDVPIYWYSSKQKGKDEVLTAFVMGPKAAYLSSLGNGAVEVILSELNNFYGSNIATNSFKAAHIEDWSKNPNILGSYSSPMVNGGGLKTRKNLFRSVQNKLFFAGEATHFQGHNSTVHGAIETGLLAANDVDTSF